MIHVEERNIVDSSSLIWHGRIREGPQTTIPRERFFCGEHHYESVHSSVRFCVRLFCLLCVCVLHNRTNLVFIRIHSSWPTWTVNITVRRRHCLSPNKNSIEQTNEHNTTPFDCTSLTQLSRVEHLQQAVVKQQHHHQLHNNLYLFVTNIIAISRNY